MTITSRANTTVADNPAGPKRKTGFRPEIQGLRAICMMQVLLYHAWHVGSPIGVDAFIMISAYLLTGSLVRRIEKGQIPGLIDRWTQLFKRLLPPLVVTVMGTLGLVLVLLPPARWPELVEQGIASVLYFQNWLLAAQSVDYYAVDPSHLSPLMHLWSMSMQGQVFLLWPLLIIGLGWLSKKYGWRIRPLVITLMTLITVASFTWMMIYRNPRPTDIYFDTRSRLWEFALGSLVALLAIWLPKVAWVRNLVSVVGVGVLVLFALVKIGAYPGPFAILPMAATAFILAGTAPVPVTKTGMKDLRQGNPVIWFLSFKPLVRFGDVSYALYLVHWPIIALYLQVLGKEHLGIFEGLFLLTVSVGLAILMTDLLDDPLRNWSWVNRKTVNKSIMVAVSLTVGLLGTFGIRHQVNSYLAQQASAAGSSNDAAGEEAFKEHPGAHIFEMDLKDQKFSALPIPTAGDVADGKQWYGLDEGCAQMPGHENMGAEVLKGCSWNKTQNPEKKVLLVGDSHMEQFAPAIVGAFEKDKTQMQLLLKGGCEYGAHLVPEDELEAEPECRQWSEEVHQWIKSQKPDLVFLISTKSHPDGPDTERPGVLPALRELDEEGLKVVGLRDNPRFAFNMYDCSSARDGEQPGVTLGGCFYPVNKVYAPQMPDQKLRELSAYHAVDLSDQICAGGTCPGIVGNRFVYLDDNHLTVDYALSLRESFQQRLDQALGE
ncbi:acyltransferase family protein [Boudabousia liubingyangii]|uniref:acyltransferase family protein n=1 Tax=Boudabousia liubingyangii TaxID=1921764 RepID=UPI0011773DD4|nr:acyltransferase family protein [Boudabousia liubingyangii]